MLGITFSSGASFDSRCFTRWKVWMLRNREQSLEKRIQPRDGATLDAWQAIELYDVQLQSFQFRCMSKSLFVYLQRESVQKQSSMGTTTPYLRAPAR